MLRCKLLLSISIVALLLMSANIQAAYVIDTLNNLLVNPSFELPGDVKHNAWDFETNAKGSFTDVPGWYSDITAADSGVESDWPGSTDGVWTGFLMNGPDPSVWQILPYKVKGLPELLEPDNFCLAVDARNNWSAGSTLGPQLEITLFYIADGGARVDITIPLVVSLTDTWTTYYLDAGDTTAAVGRLLGIAIENVTEDVWGAGSSWVGIDNVRFVVPEPATMILLGLGSLALIRRRK